MINWKSKYLKYKLKYEKLKGGDETQNQWFKGTPDTPHKIFNNHDNMSLYEQLYRNISPDLNTLNTPLEKKHYKVSEILKPYDNAKFTFVYKYRNKEKENEIVYKHFTKLKSATWLPDIEHEPYHFYLNHGRIPRIFEFIFEEGRVNQSKDYIIDEMNLIEIRVEKK